MQPTRNVFWTAELSFIAGVLGSYLQGVSKDAFAMRSLIVLTIRLFAYIWVTLP